MWYFCYFLTLIYCFSCSIRKHFEILTHYSFNTYFIFIWKTSKERGILLGFDHFVYITPVYEYKKLLVAWLSIWNDELTFIIVVCSVSRCFLSCYPCMHSCFSTGCSATCFLSSPTYFKCWLRQRPVFPGSPQQAPFSPARTVLTEKTHLPCIVKIFINSNLCHSDRASAEKENIWALYESITQVVKKICSHAI